jgi:predicted ATP-grasp superfamily ATP-dependent carboligase
MKTLILDANQRPALAITRSLGSKGIPVVVADETDKTLAGSSKYCSETFKYPSPYENYQDFIGAIKDECLKRDIKVIFPVTEITTYFILKHREQFKDIIIPFASIDKFDLLSNKIELIKLAINLNIPIPNTIIVTNNPTHPINPIDSNNSINSINIINSTLTSALDSFSTLTSTSALKSLKFPLVLKPFRSRIETNEGWLSTSVSYAYSKEELEKIIWEKPYFRDYPFLIQEYIEGEGQGVSALYNQGKLVTFFAHRRLREKPPSGGVSVLSESIEVNPFLKDISKRLLDNVSWHGVAMVEFKVSPDGSPYLMEVNARFWGSLQLAIDSGIDFPWILYRMAIGEETAPLNGYDVGIRSRWLLGDLDHLYLRLKNNGRITSKLNTLVEFLNFFDRRTRFEINRFNDLNPFLFQLKQYFKIS